MIATAVISNYKILKPNENSEMKQKEIELRKSLDHIFGLTNLTFKLKFLNLIFNNFTNYKISKSF